MNTRHQFFAVLLGAMVSLLLVNTASAIPTFARKYKTSCSTCHYAFPKLNAFGRAFWHNGFRYPAGQDEEMTKEEPVSMGAEAYKRVFPDAIWPAGMPGTSPFSVQMINRMQFYPNAEEGDPSLNFEFPHELEIFLAGNIGENVSGFAEVEFEHNIELGYEFWLQWDFKPQLHIKAGLLDPMPFTAAEHFRLTAEHYNYGNYKVAGSGWRLRNGSPGLELWGAGNGSNGLGGWTYRLGVVNGAEVDDDHKDADDKKDLYFSASYKHGGLGEVGGTEGQASETAEFYKDNSAKLTLFGYTGTDVLNPNDTTTFDHEFNALGLNADIYWERFNLIGVYAARTDGRFEADDLKSAAWMTELNYVVYPWLIGLLRYEWTDKNTDADTPDPETNLIPGAVFMLRANTKITVEYYKPLDEAREKKDKVVIGMAVSL